jgi:hypothetical protein
LDASEWKLTLGCTQGWISSTIEQLKECESTSDPLRNTSAKRSGLAGSDDRLEGRDNHNAT